MSAVAPKNSKELNEFLADTLAGLKNGTTSTETAVAVAKVADKINKNNLNVLLYKKLTQKPDKIEFLEI